MTQMKQPNGTVVKDQPAGLPCPDSSASFWHSQPNIFLLGHRTTTDLPATADVVIIGSGITGASIARYLVNDERAKDAVVVMLEAREICWGATGRNGGHCQPLLFDRTPGIAEFEIKNVAAVKSYIEENNVDCEWRSVTGCRTFWTKSTFEAAQTEINKLYKSHPEIAKQVTVSTDPKVLKANRVKPECSGVTLTQGAGQLWPYKYVTFIVEKLVREGKLNVQTHTPVLEIEGHSVNTSRGTIEAKQIILATNGYTSHLLPEFQSLIVPVRCEMSALHPPTQDRLPNSYGMVAFGDGNPEHDDYLVQRPFYNGRGGHLMFGGGRSQAMYNCVGITDDDIVDPGEADYLRRALPQMLEIGSEVELQASHQWTGIKGYSRDNRPWVGKVRDDVWLCGGYTGHGMPNATLCGKAVVELMLSDQRYEEACDKLIEAGELPESYLLTRKRLDAAHTLPTVWEQDMGL